MKKFLVSALVIALLLALALPAAAAVNTQPDGDTAGGMGAPQISGQPGGGGGLTSADGNSWAGGAPVGGGYGGKCELVGFNEFGTPIYECRGNYPV